MRVPPCTWIWKLELEEQQEVVLKSEIDQLRHDLEGKNVVGWHLTKLKLKKCLTIFVVVCVCDCCFVICRYECVMMC